MERTVRELLFLLVTGLTTLCSARAQGISRPSFEVVSVKPLDRSLIAYNSSRHQIEGDRFIGKTDLLSFIVRAYLGGSSCVMKTAIQEPCPLIAGVSGWSRQELQGRFWYRSGRETFT